MTFAGLEPPGNSISPFTYPKYTASCVSSSYFSASPDLLGCFWASGWLNDIICLEPLSDGRLSVGIPLLLTVTKG